ncbi:VanZ family protein [Halobacillus fulvus]|nr:VanZ family protein [Halobacillus fulvus]
MKKNLIWSFLISQAVYWFLFPVFLRSAYYLHPASYLMYYLVIFGVLAILVSFVRREQYVIPAFWIHAFMSVYGLLLLMLLFLRFEGNQNREINLVPFQTIELYLSNNVEPLISFYNLVANIGLFIPFGIYLVLFHQSLWVKIVAPIVGIAAIETAQLITGRGSMDIDDFLLNLIGVWIGFAIGPLIRKTIRFPKMSEEKLKR